MKFPSHILLDISKKNTSNSNQYWLFKYLFFIKKSNNFFNELTFHKKFFFSKEKLFKNSLLNAQKKFTIKYTLSNQAVFLNENEKKFIIKNYTPRLKVKTRVLESYSSNKDMYDYIKNDNLTNFDKKYLKYILKMFSLNQFSTSFKSNNIWSLFDINFLRKERIYTKLKYSRVPQYDIVSGGAAAIFAGFIGFLISEKFGFELVDSGDFYFVLMYLIFLFFFIRLFLRILNIKESTWTPFSLKWFYSYYRTLFLLFSRFIFLFIKFFKNII
jgi:hypothetical protein